VSDARPSPGDGDGDRRARAQQLAAVRFRLASVCIPSATLFVFPPFPAGDVSIRAGWLA
jgi:hypothetical protein